MLAVHSQCRDIAALLNWQGAGVRFGFRVGHWIAFETFLDKATQCIAASEAGHQHPLPLVQIPHFGRLTLLCQRRETQQE